eukprot:CAMPEP_0177657784 /NCGR_PEP_ID=MMETSP0447-20121125/16409_1 /TAXON_ID=0 /ORGANISM="Stygamoeba regulata, Strain BSH-02190019" /LENGTH=246 /DNA_ID=CAMNT_0019162241 /DNA_START=32 /DNA_END=769 /DNA_ORIENTATION=-
MPRLISTFVEKANLDSQVHIILLSGAGAGFCAGYDLKEFAEAAGPNAGVQAMPWDPMVDFGVMGAATAHFMSLWRSLKPVVCKVRKCAVAGGSDIALCCDIVIMEDDAVIGYPPARVWGCPTTAMWVYRIGAERAKRLMLTGDVISGKEAARIGLVCESHPAADLDAQVDALLDRMAGVPKNQLIMHKLVINKAIENMGLAATQTLATLMDGIARHTPEGIAFKQRCEEVGFKRAVAERDTSAFFS